MKTSRLNNQGIAHPAILILLIVILGVIGFAGWYVWKLNAPQTDSKSTQPKAHPTTDKEKTEATASTVPKLISDEWLLRESAEASIKVPDGFNILVPESNPVNFVLPNDDGSLRYEKGTRAQVVGEPHKHFARGLLATYNSTGLNDLGTYLRSFKTYSGLDVEVKFYEENDTEDTVIPYGVKWLKYKVAKGDKMFTVDYMYEGEGIVDIIDEMVKTIVIK
jgi:hypothetical protein